MVVERHVDLLFVDGIEQRFGVGNELSVPCVAVPILQTVVPRARGSVVGVPPHVEDDVVERDIVAFIGPLMVGEPLWRGLQITATLHTPDEVSRSENVFAVWTQVNPRGL